MAEKTKENSKSTVLVLGGCGNFGKRISRALAGSGVPVIVAGRNRHRAEALACELPNARAADFDVSFEFHTHLQRLRPAVVVNTCGPFQTSDYRIAESCIEEHVHYLDLADGRAFVTGITALDSRAKAKGVAVISGASTVPGLSSAVLERYGSEFSEIGFLRFGIAPGQQAERGLATTEGVMTYVGRRLKPFSGIGRSVYGWQDLYRQGYPEIGKRWMANCDVPDLDLLPAHYGIKRIQFSAGLELAPLHLGLWALSWLVRAGVPLELARRAGLLLRASDWFDRFGSPHGGMHMLMRGRDSQGRPHERQWFIVARDGSGTHIPTVPAIILARRLVSVAPVEAGAYPCVGLISLDEYLEELKAYPIETFSYTARDGRGQQRH